MKSINLKKNFLVLVAFLGILAVACNDEEDTTPSNPVIEQLSPNRGPAGTVVTFIGKRFSKVPAENIVKFDGINAEVISATDTTLQVKAPQDGGSGTVTISVNNRFSKGPVYTYGPSYGEFVVNSLAGDTIGAGNVNGTGTAARLRNPEGVAFDAAGNIIFADRGNHSIKKVTPDGVVTTIAGNGSSGAIDGPVDVARFNGPWKVAVDHLGNIIVADATHHRIRKITPDGVVSTVAGGTSGYVNAKGTAARFNGPIAVATDLQGNIFVADNNNHAVRKIAPDGTVTTLAGNGAGFGDGVWPNAKLRNPSGVFVDPQGNVLVADRGNHRIRKITQDGVVSTIAGSGVKGVTDGVGLTARFSDPYGVSIDSRGYMYVADLTSHNIRQISPTGDVTTIAGKGILGFANGPGSEAMFNQPTDAISDGKGNVYVADLSNHVLRKLTIKQ
ncbi:gluconolactonase [Rufibacter immobilis]|uniref:Gluconolactonase n=1 Tax=Rufibacter immobilis TaxID=1348778 RepID=A0A3M9MXM5_9BACT|nr:IPT/TIG domain-containing protein [Rufibacter immobilis]RNI29905.1 gluconolactonase [Rufibacter immobilis]